MDPFDQASEFEQLRRDIAMRQRKPEGPAPTGVCLFCGEPLAPGLRWCNRDCLDDWVRAERAYAMRPREDAPPENCRKVTP